MNFGPGEWIAGLCAVGGLGVWVGGLTFRAGRHTEQSSQFRRELDALKVTQDEHAKAISSWDQALKLLEEVRKDVKSLMTAPSRRRSGTGD